MKRLVVLSTQRSGSTMVCDDIAGTGFLGRPSEYFIKVIESVGKVDPQELQNLIKEVDEKGKTKNGVSAVKVMANQIRPIGNALKKAEVLDADDAEDCFYKYFKGSVFVRVVRNDKVAQAVSRVMARQTDVYHSVSDSRGLEGMLGKADKNRDESALKYERVQIQEQLEMVNSEEAMLSKFIEKYGLNVTSVVYECAIGDRAYVNDIASQLDVGSVSLADRRLKKISGSIAEEWIREFNSGL